MLDVSAALAEQGIRLRDASVGNHKVVCPVCSHSRKKKNDPCLSVTIKQDGEAVWKCHHCGFAGGAGGSEYRPARERKTYRKPERVAAPQRPDTLVRYFGKRGISEAVVEQFGVYKTRHWFPQLKAEDDCIAFPYEWRAELRNVKYRNADKLFVQEKDPEPVFYNAESIVAGEDLIVTEGEIDVLSFAQAGFEHVVSLPNGAPSEPENSDKRYEPFGTHWEEVLAAKRILIATDMDGPGEMLAQEIARRVGKDRCWRVRMPASGDHQTKDANDCLTEHGVKTLQECVELAQPWPIDGLYTAMTFEGDVLDLYHGRGPKPLSTGFPELDKAFKYIPGQFVVVTGIPNHGKSRFLDQVAVQTARLREEKWAIFSPETAMSQHLADIIEIWSAAPFFDGPHMRVSEADVSAAMAWIDDYMFFINTDDHTPTIDWILERGQAAVVRHGVKHLLIDPYNEVEAGRPEKQTETEFISQLISKCKRFGQRYDVTVWMMVHPTKLKGNGEDGKDPIPGLYDLSGSAHWRNKTDAGIVVYRDYDAAATYVTSKKIRRQPICGEPGAVRFSFSPTSRRFDAVPGSYKRLGESK